MQTEDIIILGDFRDEELAALYDCSIRQSYACGELVVEEGGEDQALYLILEGAVESFSRTRQGEEHVFGAMESGMVFGELAFLDGGDRSASVRTLRDCTVLMLSREAFARLQASHPETAAKLLADLSRVVCRRLRNMDRYVMVQVETRAAQA